MTRETKVALLVGLGIILLIGIIISEHLSATDDLPALTRDNQRPARADGRRSDLPPALRRHEPSGDGQGQTQRQDTASPQSGPAVPPPETPTRAQRELERELEQMRQQLASAQREAQRWRTEAERLRQGTERRRRDGATPAVPPPSPRTQEDAATTQRGGQAAEQAAQQQAPSPIEHVVRQGERLWDISLRYYGEGRHWRRIKQANADRITGEAGIRIGDTLLIPPAPELQTQTRTQTQTERQPQRQADAQRTADRGSGRQYRISANDTLWSIAERELGDATRWRELYELNRNVITEPALLPVGREIRLPQ